MNGSKHAVIEFINSHGAQETARNTASRACLRYLPHTWQDNCIPLKVRDPIKQKFMHIGSYSSG